jgi:hypothetical protein
MNDQRRHDEDLPVALRELGDHLRAAAHREYGRQGPSWHRVPRRGLALAAALVVVGVGGATAAGLISVGAPASDQRDLPATLRPNAAARTIAVTAADPGRKLPWAVATYTARDGRDCALLGQAQLGTLGELTGGTFHPYAADRPGACGRLDRAPLFFEPAHSAGRPQRTLVFGRARPGVSAVSIKDASATHTVKTGPGGAFLAVLDGRLPNGTVRVSPATGG